MKYYADKLRDTHWHKHILSIYNGNWNEKKRKEMKNTFNFYQITMAILSNFRVFFLRLNHSLNLSHLSSPIFFIHMQMQDLFRNIPTFVCWRRLIKKICIEILFMRTFFNHERKWRSIIKLIEKGEMEISSTIHLYYTHTRFLTCFNFHVLV